MHSMTYFSMMCVITSVGGYDKLYDADPLFIWPLLCTSILVWLSCASLSSSLLDSYGSCCWWWSVYLDFLLRYATVFTNLWNYYDVVVQTLLTMGLQREAAGRGTMAVYVQVSCCFNLINSESLCNTSRLSLHPSSSASFSIQRPLCFPYWGQSLSLVPQCLSQ